MSSSFTHSSSWEPPALQNRTLRHSPRAEGDRAAAAAGATSITTTSIIATPEPSAALHREGRVSSPTTITTSTSVASSTSLHAVGSGTFSSTHQLYPPRHWRTRSGPRAVSVRSPSDVNSPLATSSSGSFTTQNVRQPNSGGAGGRLSEENVDGGSCGNNNSNNNKNNDSNNSGTASPPRSITQLSYVVPPAVRQPVVEGSSRGAQLPFFERAPHSNPEGQRSEAAGGGGDVVTGGVVSGPHSHTITLSSGTSVLATSLSTKATLFAENTPTPNAAATTTAAFAGLEESNVVGSPQCSTQPPQHSPTHISGKDQHPPNCYHPPSQLQQQQQTPTESVADGSNHNSNNNVSARKSHNEASLRAHVNAVRSLGHYHDVLEGSGVSAAGKRRRSLGAAETPFAALPTTHRVPSSGSAGGEPAWWDSAHSLSFLSGSPPSNAVGEGSAHARCRSAVGDGAVSMLSSQQSRGIQHARTLSSSAVAAAAVEAAEEDDRNGKGCASHDDASALRPSVVTFDAAEAHQAVAATDRDVGHAQAAETSTQPHLQAGQAAGYALSGREAGEETPQRMTDSRDGGPRFSSSSPVLPAPSISASTPLISDWQGTARTTHRTETAELIHCDGAEDEVSARQRKHASLPADAFPPSEKVEDHAATAAAVAGESPTDSPVSALLSKRQKTERGIDFSPCCEHAAAASLPTALPIPARETPSVATAGSTSIPQARRSQASASLFPDPPSTADTVPPAETAVQHRSEKTSENTSTSAGTAAAASALAETSVETPLQAKATDSAPAAAVATTGTTTTATITSAATTPTTMTTTTTTATTTNATLRKTSDPPTTITTPGGATSISAFSFPRAPLNLRPSLTSAPHAAPEAAVMKHLRVALIDARSVQGHLAELQALLLPRPSSAVAAAGQPSGYSDGAVTTARRPSARQSDNDGDVWKQDGVDVVDGAYSARASEETVGTTTTTTPRDVGSTHKSATRAGPRSADVQHPVLHPAALEAQDDTRLHSNNSECVVCDSGARAENDDADEGFHVADPAFSVPAFKVGGLYTPSLNAYRQQRLTRLTEHHLRSLWQNMRATARGVCGTSVRACVRAAVTEAPPRVSESSLQSAVWTLKCLHHGRQAAGKAEREREDATEALTPPDETKCDTSSECDAQIEGAAAVDSTPSPPRRPFYATGRCSMVSDADSLADERRQLSSTKLPISNPGSPPSPLLAPEHHHSATTTATTINGLRHDMSETFAYEASSGHTTSPTTTAAADSVRPLTTFWGTSTQVTMDREGSVWPPPPPPPQLRASSSSPRGSELPPHTITTTITSSSGGSSGVSAGNTVVTTALELSAHLRGSPPPTRAASSTSPSRSGVTDVANRTTASDKTFVVHASLTDSSRSAGASFKTPTVPQQGNSHANSTYLASTFTPTASTTQHTNTSAGSGNLYGTVISGGGGGGGGVGGHQHSYPITSPVSRCGSATSSVSFDCTASTSGTIFVHNSPASFVGCVAVSGSLQDMFMSHASGRGDFMPSTAGASPNSGVALNSPSGSSSGGGGGIGALSMAGTQNNNNNNNNAVTVNGSSSLYSSPTSSLQLAHYGAPLPGTANNTMTSTAGSAGSSGGGGSGGCQCFVPASYILPSTLLAQLRTQFQQEDQQQQQQQQPQQQQQRRCAECGEQQGEGEGQRQPLQRETSADRPPVAVLSSGTSADSLEEAPASLTGIPAPRHTSPAPADPCASAVAATYPSTSPTSPTRASTTTATTTAGAGTLHTTARAADHGGVVAMRHTAENHDGVTSPINGVPSLPSSASPPGVAHSPPMRPPPPPPPPLPTPSPSQSQPQTQQQQQQSSSSMLGISLPPRHSPSSSWHSEISGNANSSLGNAPPVSPWSLPPPSPIPPPPPAAAQRGAAAAAAAAAAAGGTTTTATSESGRVSVSAAGAHALPALAPYPPPPVTDGNSSSSSGNGGNSSSANAMSSGGAGGTTCGASAGSTRHGAQTVSTHSSTFYTPSNSFSIASVLSVPPVKAPFIKVQREEVAVDAVPGLDSSATISVARRAAAAAAAAAAVSKSSRHGSTSRRSGSREKDEAVRHHEQHHHHHKQQQQQQQHPPPAQQTSAQNFHEDDNGDRQGSPSSLSGHVLSDSPVMTSHRRHAHHSTSEHLEKRKGTTAAATSSAVSSSPPPPPPSAEARHRSDKAGAPHAAVAGGVASASASDTTTTTTTTTASLNTLHTTSTRDVELRQQAPSSPVLPLPPLQLSPYGLRVEEAMTALPTMHESTESVMRELHAHGEGSGRGGSATTTTNGVNGDGATPTSSDAASMFCDVVASRRSQSSPQSGSVSPRSGGAAVSAMAAVRPQRSGSPYLPTPTGAALGELEMLVNSSSFTATTTTATTTTPVVQGLPSESVTSVHSEEKAEEAEEGRTGGQTPALLLSTPAAVNVSVSGHTNSIFASSHMQPSTSTAQTSPRAMAATSSSTGDNYWRASVENRPFPETHMDDDEEEEEGEEEGEGVDEDVVKGQRKETGEMQGDGNICDRKRGEFDALDVDGPSPSSCPACLSRAQLQAWQSTQHTKLPFQFHLQPHSLHAAGEDGCANTTTAAAAAATTAASSTVSLSASPISGQDTSQRTFQLPPAPSSLLSFTSTPPPSPDSAATRQHAVGNLGLPAWEGGEENGTDEHQPERHQESSAEDDKGGVHDERAFPVPSASASAEGEAEVVKVVDDTTSSARQSASRVADSVPPRNSADEQKRPPLVSDVSGGASLSHPLRAPSPQSLSETAAVNVSEAAAASPVVDTTAASPPPSLRGTAEGRHDSRLLPPPSSPPRRPHSTPSPLPMPSSNSTLNHQDDEDTATMIVRRSSSSSSSSDSSSSSSSCRRRSSGGDSERSSFAQEGRSRHRRVDESTSAAAAHRGKHDVGSAVENARGTGVQQHQQQHQQHPPTQPFLDGSTAAAVAEVGTSAEAFNTAFVAAPLRSSDLTSRRLSTLRGSAERPEHPPQVANRSTHTPCKDDVAYDEESEAATPQSRRGGRSTQPQTLVGSLRDDYLELASHHDPLNSQDAARQQQHASQANSPRRMMDVAPVSAMAINAARTRKAADALSAPPDDEQQQQRQEQQLPSNAEASSSSTAAAAAIANDTSTSLREEEMNAVSILTGGSLHPADLRGAMFFASSGSLTVSAQLSANGPQPSAESLPEHQKDSVKSAPSLITTPAAAAAAAACAIAPPPAVSLTSASAPDAQAKLPSSFSLSWPPIGSIALTTTTTTAAAALPLPTHAAAAATRARSHKSDTNVVSPHSLPSSSSLLLLPVEEGSDRGSGSRSSRPHPSSLPNGGSATVLSPPSLGSNTARYTDVEVDAMGRAVVGEEDNKEMSSVELGLLTPPSHSSRVEVSAVDIGAALEAGAASAMVSASDFGGSSPEVHAAAAAPKPVTHLASTLSQQQQQQQCLQEESATPKGRRILSSASTSLPAVEPSTSLSSAGGADRGPAETAAASAHGSSTASSLVNTAAPTAVPSAVFNSDSQPLTQPPPPLPQSEEQEPVQDQLSESPSQSVVPVHRTTRAATAATPSVTPFGQSPSRRQSSPLLQLSSSFLNVSSSGPSRGTVSMHTTNSGTLNASGTAANHNTTSNVFMTTPSSTLTSATSTTTTVLSAPVNGTSAHSSGVIVGAVIEVPSSSSHSANSTSSAAVVAAMAAASGTSGPQQQLISGSSTTNTSTPTTTITDTTTTTAAGTVNTANATTSSSSSSAFFFSSSSTPAIPTTATTTATTTSSSGGGAATTTHTSSHHSPAVCTTTYNYTNNNNNANSLTLETATTTVSLSSASTTSRVMDRGSASRGVSASPTRPLPINLPSPPPRLNQQRSGEVGATASFMDADGPDHHHCHHHVALSHDLPAGSAVMRCGEEGEEGREDGDDGGGPLNLELTATTVSAASTSVATNPSTSTTVLGKLKPLPPLPPFQNYPFPLPVETSVDAEDDDDEEEEDDEAPAVAYAEGGRRDVVGRDDDDDDVSGGREDPKTGSRGRKDRRRSSSDGGDGGRSDAEQSYEDDFEKESDSSDEVPAAHRQTPVSTAAVVEKSKGTPSSLLPTAPSALPAATTATATAAARNMVPALFVPTLSQTPPRPMADAGSNSSSSGSAKKPKHLSAALIIKAVRSDDDDDDDDDLHHAETAEESALEDRLPTDVSAALPPYSDTADANHTTSHTSSRSSSRTSTSCSEGEAEIRSDSSDDSSSCMSEDGVPHSAEHRLQHHRHYHHHHHRQHRSSTSPSQAAPVTPLPALPALPIIKTPRSGSSVGTVAGMQGTNNNGSSGNNNNNSSSSGGGKASSASGAGPGAAGGGGVGVGGGTGAGGSNRSSPRGVVPRMPSPLLSARSPRQYQVSPLRSGTTKTTSTNGKTQGTGERGLKKGTSTHEPAGRASENAEQQLHVPRTPQSPPVPHRTRPRAHTFSPTRGIGAADPTLSRAVAQQRRSADGEYIRPASHRPSAAPQDVVVRDEHRESAEFCMSRSRSSRSSHSTHSSHSSHHDDDHTDAVSPAAPHDGHHPHHSRQRRRRLHDPALRSLPPDRSFVAAGASATLRSSIGGDVALSDFTATTTTAIRSRSAQSRDGNDTPLSVYSLGHASALPLRPAQFHRLSPPLQTVLSGELWASPSSCASDGGASRANSVANVVMGTTPTSARRLASHSGGAATTPLLGSSTSATTTTTAAAAVATASTGTAAAADASSSSPHVMSTPGMLVTAASTLSSHLTAATPLSASSAALQDTSCGQGCAMLSSQTNANTNNNNNNASFCPSTVSPLPPPQLAMSVSSPESSTLPHAGCDTPHNTTTTFVLDDSPRPAAAPAAEMAVEAKMAEEPATFAEEERNSSCVGEGDAVVDGVRQSPTHAVVVTLPDSRRDSTSPPLEADDVRSGTEVLTSAPQPHDEMPATDPCNTNTENRTKRDGEVRRGDARRAANGLHIVVQTSHASLSAENERVHSHSSHKNHEFNSDHSFAESVADADPSSTTTTVVSGNTTSVLDANATPQLRQVSWASVTVSAATSTVAAVRAPSSLIETPTVRPRDREIGSRTTTTAAAAATAASAATLRASADSSHNESYVLADGFDENEVQENGGRDGEMIAGKEGSSCEDTQSEAAVWCMFGSHDAAAQQQQQQHVADRYAELEGCEATTSDLRGCGSLASNDSWASARRSANERDDVPDSRLREAVDAVVAEVHTQSTPVPLLAANPDASRTPQRTAEAQEALPDPATPTALPSGLSVDFHEASLTQHSGSVNVGAESSSEEEGKDEDVVRLDAAGVAAAAAAAAAVVMVREQAAGSPTSHTVVTTMLGGSREISMTPQLNPFNDPTPDVTVFSELGETCGGAAAALLKVVVQTPSADITAIESATTPPQNPLHVFSSTHHDAPSAIPSSSAVLTSPQVTPPTPKEGETSHVAAAAGTAPAVASPPSQLSVHLPSYYRAQCEDGLRDVTGSRTAWHSTTSAFFPADTTTTHGTAFASTSPSLFSSAAASAASAVFSPSFTLSRGSGERDGYAAASLSGTGTSRPSSVYAASSALARRRALIRASYDSVDRGYPTPATAAPSTVLISNRGSVGAASACASTTYGPEGGAARRSDVQVAESSSSSSSSRHRAAPMPLDSDAALLALMRRTMEPENR